MMPTVNIQMLEIADPTKNKERLPHVSTHHLNEIMLAINDSKLAPPVRASEMDTSSKPAFLKIVGAK